jgi:hypothetical protein
LILPASIRRRTVSGLTRNNSATWPMRKPSGTKKL